MAQKLDQATIDEVLQYDPMRQQEAPDADELSPDIIQEVLQYDPMRQQEPPAGYEPKPGPFPGAGSPIDVRSGRPQIQMTTPPEMGAGFGTMMKASLVNDPATKIRIFAKARGIPESEIPKRYRVDRKGKIEFLSDQGTWQREVSPVMPMPIVQGAAEVAGHPSTYLGTAGAAFLGPAGAIGGAMGGEALRRGIGRIAYDEPQTAGDVLTGILLEGVFAAGGEMMGKLISSSINRGLARKAGALKSAGQEIKDNLLTPQDHAKAIYINSLAEQHNIKLAPHQLYDREGMTNIWKYLRRHPLTSNQVQKFEGAIADASDDAINNLIKRMGGFKDTPVAMGKKLKRASQGAIEQAEEVRRRVAKPAYERAFRGRSAVDMDEVASEIQRNTAAIRSLRDIPEQVDTATMINEIKTEFPSFPTMKQRGESAAAYGQRIAKDYKRLLDKDPPMLAATDNSAKIQQLQDRNAALEKVLAGEDPGGSVDLPRKNLRVNTTDAINEINNLMDQTVPGDPSFAALKRIKNMIRAASGDPRKLDRVKRSGIDNVLTKTKTNRTLTREMAKVKDQLVTAIERDFPDYEVARAAYAAASKPVDRLRESIIGQLANLEGDKNLATATRKLFKSTNMPDEQLVKEARKIITAQDPDLWNRSIGNYIRDVYENLMVTEEGVVANAVGKLQKRLFGSKKQQALMAAALGGKNSQEYQALKNLMTVFQRASIGAGKESMTAPFQMIERELGGQMGSRLKMLARQPYQYSVDAVFGFWNDALLMRNQEALLKALVAPDVTAKLVKLKQLTPGGRKFIETLATMTALTYDKIGGVDDAGGYEVPPEAETAIGQTLSPSMP